MTAIRRLKSRNSALPREPGIDVGADRAEGSDATAPDGVVVLGVAAEAGRSTPSTQAGSAVSSRTSASPRVAFDRSAQARLPRPSPL